jgi:Flp pilus assembly pilin Flp
VLLIEKCKKHEQTYKIKGDKKMDKIKRFLNDEEGSIAIEYVVLAGLIGVALTVAATALKNSIATEMGEVGTAVDAIIT